jgi:hypothetical protein
MSYGTFESYYLVAGAGTKDILQGSILQPGMEIKIFGVTNNSWVAVGDTAGYTLSPLEDLNGTDSSYQVGYFIKENKELSFTYRGTPGKLLLAASSSGVDDSVISVGVL